LKKPLEGTYTVTINHCAQVKNIAVLGHRINFTLDKKQP
jgi:hypothetical protein